MLSLIEHVFISSVCCLPFGTGFLIDEAFRIKTVVPTI